MIPFFDKRCRYCILVAANFQLFIITKFSTHGYNSIVFPSSDLRDDKHFFVDHPGAVPISTTQVQYFHFLFKFSHRLTFYLTIFFWRGRSWRSWLGQLLTLNVVQRHNRWWCFACDYILYLFSSLLFLNVYCIHTPLVFWIAKRLLAFFFLSAKTSYDSILFSKLPSKIHYLLIEC